MENANQETQDLQLQQKRQAVQESSRLPAEALDAMQQGIPAQVKVLQELFPKMKIG